MTNTCDCCKLESIVFSVVPDDLGFTRVAAGEGPRAVWLEKLHFDVTLQLFNPLNSSDGWNRTVGVSTENKDSVSFLDHMGINEIRGVGSRSVVDVSAHVPGMIFPNRGVVPNVESLSDGFVVEEQVSSDVIDAWRSVDIRFVS